MANQLPWESGTWMPYQVGQAFVGPDGKVWVTSYDPNSPTGVSASVGGGAPQPIPAPFDQNKADEYWRGTPIGQRSAAQEKASAYNTGFDQDIRQGTLDVNRQNADTTRQTSQAQVEQAKRDLQFKYYQQGQTFQTAQGTLGLNTLELGSKLRGPRNWDQYLETAASAGQNPMLRQGMDAWANLTGIRPNTGAVSGPMPQRFDLNALASDFMGGGGQGGGGGQPRRIEALDTVAMGGSAQPGWWQGLSEPERQRAQGYWETRGWDPSDVLGRLAYQSPNQNLSYGGA